ncbi:MAG: peptidyl-prolyl cis-trans isomerase [Rectinema sp.]|nr:peptidyl-prolyl cis-trans isomerase [Rectinema sp.]
MKRILTTVFILGILAAGPLAAQTSIDKPAATIKLTRQEVISVRQLRADVERLENATGIKMTVDQRKDVLDARINSMLFLQFCEREKISVSDAQVNATLNQLKSQLGPGATDADLEKSLRTTGVFVEPKVYVRQRLLFEAYVQTKKLDDLKAALQPPTADDILKAYDLAKASLVRPDTIRISVIYVDTKGKTDQEVAKAKELINSIAAALKSNPSKFDEYVLRAGNSSGYKAIPSLYLEKTAQSKTIFGAEFFDAAFKTKPGEITPVIQTPTGYRIVRNNEFIPQKQLTLSDPVPGNQNMTVQEFLTYQLASEKEQQFMDATEADLIQALRKEATIKIYTENLNW